MKLQRSIFMKSKNIIILGRNSLSTLILYNALSLSHDVKCVILENEESRRIFLKRRIKKLGLIRVLDQLLFITIFTKLLKFISKKRTLEIIKMQNISLDPIPESKILKVESINSQNVIEILQTSHHDYIVLSGTRILSKGVINSVKSQILNIHAGITPNYRGVHGAYWAYVNRESNLAGVTLHRVDYGVDTGNIIDQELIMITKNDNLVTYPYLQLFVGIHMLLKFIQTDNSKCCVKEKMDNLVVSKQWYHPGLSQYLYNLIVLGVK
jgi:methionyl-tRNA formyltransferase